MDENLRNAIAENLEMLKGKRVFFGEHANQYSDQTPRMQQQQRAKADDDVLDVLREEASAAVGGLSREWIAAFAETF